LPVLTQQHHYLSEYPNLAEVDTYSFLLFLFLYFYKMSISEKKINELRPGMRGINVKVKVDSISEPRNVNLRTGGQAKVADAQVSDETGVIKLSLWDDQINMIEEGDMILIENGYTHAFRGENNLNIGKYGKIVKL
jgi:replication factor A1